MPRSQPPNPKWYRDPLQWASDFFEFYNANTRFGEPNDPLPLLLPHKTDHVTERATTDGILLWDPVYRSIVYSEGGIWRPINMSFGVFLAEQQILREYGDTVSVAATARINNKFGRNTNHASGTEETVWLTGGTETYPAVGTNPIDRIVSDNAADTSQVTVVTFTDDGSGNLTRLTQTVTLTGTTPVALTASNRAERVRLVDGETALVGNITVYESATPANIHVTITAGLQQSYKAAQSTASNEYLLITAVEVGVSRANTGAIDFTIEDRVVGSVFKPMTGRLFRRNDGTTDDREDFGDTLLIVRPNSDVRINGIASAANMGSTGIIFGYFAEIQ